jgi:fructoselysine-6-phosphate deglycase
MQPAALLLQRRSGFPAFMEIAAELVTAGHQALGKGSIVVIPSLSGTTKESVATLEFCRDKGASIITLVGHKETPWARRPTTPSSTSRRTTRRPSPSICNRC